MELPRGTRVAGSVVADSFVSSPGAICVLETAARRLACWGNGDADWTVRTLDRAGLVAAHPGSFERGLFLEGRELVLRSFVGGPATALAPGPFALGAFVAVYDSSSPESLRPVLVPAGARPTGEVVTWQGDRWREVRRGSGEPREWSGQHVLYADGSVQRVASVPPARSRALVAPADPIRFPPTSTSLATMRGVVCVVSAGEAVCHLEEVERRWRPPTAGSTFVRVTVAREICGLDDAGAVWCWSPAPDLPSNGRMRRVELGHARAG